MWTYQSPSAGPMVTVNGMESPSRVSSGSVAGNRSAIHEYPATPESASAPGFQERSTSVSVVGTPVAGSDQATDGSESGGTVSRRMLSTAWKLTFPAASPEVRLMGFAPSVRDISYDHSVPASAGQMPAPFSHTSASGSLVPESVWVITFVGVVTGFSTGAPGGFVSRKMLDSVTPEPFPAPSALVRLMGFAPSVRGRL